jgi:membrane-associated phospholipid phosphatase
MAFAGLARFTGFELGLWAGLYGAYLATRNFAIGSADEAYANASMLIDVERGVGAFHEVAVQRALATDLHLESFFDLYYMVGFGPVIGAVLVWLVLRHRGEYRQLRTWLLLSIAIASIGYILLPTAPPRLVDGIGIADTVGLSGHDTGSVGGVKFNPYAAMPSMHVGWSLLVGLIGFRVARRRPVKALFILHPLVMAVTVTATGNHYFIDSVVGALVALSAVAIVAAQLPSRIRARLSRPRLAGGDAHKERALPARPSAKTARAGRLIPRVPVLTQAAVGAPCSSH